MGSEELIRSKAICSIKLDTIGEIIKWKMRFCARGDLQIRDEESKYRVSPTAGHTAVLIVLQVGQERFHSQHTKHVLGEAKND